LTPKEQPVHDHFHSASQELLTG